jgi:hypothetical protein
MIAQVTSATAFHLAAGGLFLTAMISLAERLPPGFVRFCTASSAGLALFAALLGSPPAAVRLTWAGLALVSFGWYLALRLRLSSGKGKGGKLLLHAVAAAAALAAVFLTAIDSGAAPLWLALVSTASSSLLLGAVTVTMILGHWYLVDTSLSIAPLADGARWVAFAVVARWGSVAAALLSGGWELLRVGRPADLIFSTAGLFFLFRSLMGLGAPLVLAGLIWQTVKIRSTQSATGLLYVALILVLFGELVSEFLHVLTGYPL